MGRHGACCSAEASAVRPQLLLLSGWLVYSARVPRPHWPWACAAVPHLSRRLCCSTPACIAVAAYCQLAADWGLSGTSLALRFVLAHPLVASAVIGATSSEQLAELIAAARAPPLEEELLEAVDAIHRRYPSPAP